MFGFKIGFNRSISQTQSNLKSKRGMSLISAVTGIGVTSVVIGVMSSLMLRLTVETRENRLILSRDQLKSNMDLLLMNKRTIDNSIAQNAIVNKDLSTCLLGSSNPLDKCVALDSSSNPQKVPFTLYPPSATHAVSGPLGTPIYYSDNGTICPNPIPGKGCPFTIETWFIADCGGAADCATAVDANFYYEIKRVEGNPIRPGTNKDLPMAWSTLLGNQGGSTQAALGESSDSPPASCIGTVLDPVCCVNRGNLMECWNMLSGIPLGTSVNTELKRSWKYDRDPGIYHSGPCPAEGEINHGISHTTKITLINPQGTPLRYLEGGG